MSHDVIKLSYADMPEIHRRATQARAANDEAIAKITAALNAHAHVGASGQTADALVAQVFKPNIDALNGIIARFNNAVAAGMQDFNQTDIRNANRLGGA